MDIATPHETKSYHVDESGEKILLLPQLTAEEQYAAAFRRRWPDVEIERQAESAVAARLQEEPEVVLRGVIAGLDGWMLELRRQNRAEAKWRRLLGLVELLDYSESRRQLRALLIGAAPPRAADVAELLGGRPPWIALWKLGRGNEWRHLRQLRERIDVSAEPVLTVLLLAQASNEVSDRAGAEEVLRLALARRPDEVAFLDALGKVLERQGVSRLAEAIGCFRAARAKHPGLGLALGRALIHAGEAMKGGSRFLLNGQTLEQAGQAAAEGEAILRDLVRLEPKNPEMLIALGDALSLQRKNAEAEAVYRKAIAIQPDDAIAYFRLGSLLDRSDRGRLAEAEAVYRKAIAIRPDDARAYISLGNALNYQGKHAEAEAVYRKAIALQPNNARAYISLGSALNYQGKHAEAEAVYRKAIALQPNNAEAAYEGLDRVLKVQGKPPEAEAVYRKAIALEPKKAGTYIRLGITLSNQGKYAEEEAVYRKAIALEPKKAGTYISLGNTLSNQGKSTEAEATFRKAIALEKNNLNRWTSYYYLGYHLSNWGRHAEAEAAFRKAIAILPDYSLLHDSLGDALNNQGKHAEAEAAYRKAIALQPNQPWPYVSLGYGLRSQAQLRRILNSLPARP